MRIFDRITDSGHEQIVFCQDAAANYRSILAIHSTRLGPAIGGTRFFRYASEDDALQDALRLSRAMTYKNALAGLRVGGGKAVILAPAGDFDREALFRAHGRFVDRLGGRFFTGEDVGTTTDDMEFVALETKWVGGRKGREGGDPSPWTALGLYCAIEAVSEASFGSRDLRGRRVAIQGLGNVGGVLAERLFETGAKLIVADVDPARVQRAVDAWGAEAAAPDRIHAVKADIFAPCAMGGILNDETIGEIRSRAVAGAANNQLLEDRHGLALADRGILYAPDYVVNAGGVMTAGVGRYGWSMEELERRVRGIFETVLEVVRVAEREGIPTCQAADRLAETRMAPADSTGK